MTALLLILTAMKKTTSNTVRQQVWSELHKLFGRFIEGTEGWIYSKQSRWSSTHVFQRLAQAALENSSLEDVCTSFKGCSPDTVQYRLKGLDFDKTVQQINDILRYNAQSFQIHKNTILTIAVDVTDYPWYGDRDHELSVGSKEKVGTLFFNRYFTACILTKTYRIPIYVCPLRQEDGVSPYKLMKDLIREINWWCPFSRVLADAWFFSKELYDLLDLYKIEYLFNLKTQRIGKQKLEMIRETQRFMAKCDDVDVSNPKIFYKWLKKHRLLTFKFDSFLTMRNNRRFPVVVQTVLAKKKKGRKPHKEYIQLYAYTTNISASGEYLKDLYKLRWGIETQYRVTHQFQAKTTSLCTNLRILLVGLSFILTGLWLRVNLVLNRIKSHTDSVIDFNLPIKINVKDILVLTVPRLKRIIQAIWWMKLGGEK